MKKTYEKARMEISVFDATEVIVASSEFVEPSVDKDPDDLPILPAK